MQLLLATPRDFLDRHFESDSLKAMMAAWGLHVDFTPDTAGGALFPYLESMANQAFGMVIGQGGADTIIRAMTSLLQELGGELLLNAPVQTIEQENGRASGVVLVDGRRLKARKAVIANLNPQLVFGHLVQSAAVPKDYQKKVDAFRPGLGTMMIHLALDGLPDWKAGAELQRFSYVHLAPDMAMMSRVYAEAAAGLLPAEPVLVDLEQFNANLIGGDNLSGSHHLDQNFFFRPVAGYSKYKTPIKDLYLCGASTWPGAGTGAGSGYMLANLLAK
uniref:Pyridine nucleotide-disulfide oxidoreductase domain-containing protein 2 n=1 Tax=Steinernema glaseri TaxID=37863 RepID=A0A1I8AEJ1_9BILA